jgi:hypothetical protein
MSLNEDAGSRIRTWLDVTRQVLLIGAVIVAVTRPQATGNYFKKLGFTTLKTPVGDVDLTSVQAAAGGVDSARRAVTDAADALTTLSSGLPAVARDRVTSVASGLNEAATQLQLPNQVLGSALRDQADDPGAAHARVGWIYCGQVDESKQVWVPQGRSNLVQTPTAVKVGEVVTLTDDVYIRNDSGTAQKSAGAVVGVARPGNKAHVLSVDYSPALSGGSFLWLRVSID